MREVRAHLEPNQFASPYVMDSSAIAAKGRCSIRNRAKADLRS